MVVVLHRDLGELLEGGAVFPAVLDAQHGEHCGHGARSHEPFGRDAHVGRAAAQQAAPHLFDAKAKHEVVQPRLHRDPSFPEGRGAGCAGVRRIDDRDPGLTDMAQDPLAQAAIGLAYIAAIERLDVADTQPGVVQRQEHGLCADVLDGSISEPAELNHVRANNIDVAHRGASLGSGNTQFNSRAARKRGACSAPPCRLAPQDFRTSPAAACRT